MDSKQLTQGLQQAFFKEDHRIVFWYDPECAFAETLGDIQLPDVQVLDMQHASTFETKLKLELEDTQSKFLLYFRKQSLRPKTTGCWTSSCTRAVFMLIACR